MQGYIRSLFLFLTLSLALQAPLAAQSDRRPAPEKPAKKISPIGFGFNIGNLQLGNRSFQFGLSPNIAYRFSENLAAGFMLKLQYSSFRPYSNSPIHFNGLDLGPTVFVRYKPLWFGETMTPFLKGLFIQVEYERAATSVASFDELTQTYPLKGNRILAEYIGEDYLYVGIGASYGYPVGSFVSLHYNVLDHYTLSRNPWDYRIGFTFNY